MSCTSLRRRDVKSGFKVSPVAAVAELESLGAFALIL